MNKKGVAVVLVFITIIGILIGIVILRGKSDDEEVSRYEWMEMLCEQEGLTEYKNQNPYFSDVNEDDFYFPYLQSAVEWEVLDAAADFDGEKCASGRFVALTAMKTIGQSKMKIYLDTEDEITDDSYIELAVMYGLIEEKQLAEKMSADECEQVLEVLENIYFSDFWRDDYSSVTYQNGVVELTPEDILQCNTDCSEIVIAGDVSDFLEPGTIIVFEEKNTKLKIARKVVGFSFDGTVLLSSAELDEVVESITVSDITELSFENIVNYHMLRESANAVNSLEYRQAEADINDAAVFSTNVNSRGYKITLSTEGDREERHIEVQITDNATGVSVTMPVNGKIEADSEYSVEIDIDKICIGAQVSYSIWDGLKYAEAAVDAHASFSGAVKADKDVKILLCKASIPLGGGIIGADIQVYLVLSAEGSISFEAELPVGVSVYYEKNRGLRSLKQNISPENPTVEANCNMGAMLRLEPMLVILGCLNVIDVEADMGVVASASVATRPNSQICADISVSFPVITLSVCGDDDADTIVGKMGLSAEWEIISPEKAPVKFGLHYELLPDKTVQFVKICTYDEDAASNDESVDANKDPTVSNDEFAVSGNQEFPEMKNTYITKMKEAGGIAVPTFMFDYPDGWTILEENVYDGAITRFENMRLTNESGTEVYYSYCIYTDRDRRSEFRFEQESTISKLADSSFVPGYARTTDYSDSGKFIIVKTTASDYPSPYYYAVKPESDCGAHSISGVISPNYFWYDGTLSFSVVSPEELTPDEEQEVIAILSSFRVMDDGTPTAEEDGGASEEDSILAALQEGDFSYFAGTYRSHDRYNFGYGSDIADLILREDGTIVGGGPGFSPNPYPETKPKWVTKKEDGAYWCQVTGDGYDSGMCQEYFLIYPEGVIRNDSLYNYDDPFLMETLYIQYMTFDGGVSDKIFYKVEEE